MIIDKLNIGAHGKTVKYAVCADATETGDKLHEIEAAMDKRAADIALTVSD